MTLLFYVVNFSCKSNQASKSRIGEGIIYNQYEGYSIKGKRLAQGWRTDSLNFGFNKEVNKNPYYLKNDLHKGMLLLNKSLKFFYYQNGVAINGNHEILEESTIFICYFKDGKADGKAQFKSDKGFLLAEGRIDDGELVGEWIFYHINLKKYKVSIYEKGKSLPIEMTIFDTKERPLYYYVCSDDKFMELRKTYIY